MSAADVAQQTCRCYVCVEGVLGVGCSLSLLRSCVREQACYLRMCVRWLGNRPVCLSVRPPAALVASFRFVREVHCDRCSWRVGCRTVSASC